MPDLQVITDWVRFDGGIGNWTIATDFEVGASAPSILGDITPYVKSYSIARGRSSELDRFGAGQLTLVLDSPCGLFLPRNTSGCLSGSLIAGRRVSLQWTLSGSTFQRFTGKTAIYTPEPDVGGQREVTIVCSDDFEGFQRRETRSALYNDIRSGSLISLVLDNAEFPSASRDLDAGQDVYEFAHFNQRKVDEVLVDINQTEYGQVFIRGDGYFVFHDRYYRSQTTSVGASFVDTMSGITYHRDVGDIRTQARVSVLPRTVKPDATLWTIRDPISINPNSTASWFGSYVDPSTCQQSLATSVASPTIGGGAIMNSNASGTGTNLSANLSACLTAFAESFKVVASNSGATTGYITTFRVTGCPIVSYEQISRDFTVAAACALYGVRTLPYDAPLMSNADKAQDFAQFLALRYSDPENTDKVTMTILNGTVELWEQILRRELDDRIAVTNVRDTGLDGVDFFIGYLSEQFDVDPGLHSVTWTLELFGSNDGFFLVDTDEVGGTKGLGY